MYGDTRDGPTIVPLARRVDRQSEGGASCFTVGLSLGCLDKPRVVLTDLARFDEGPGALPIETPKILLHLGDVGFKISPDHIGIGPHVLIALRQERSLRRNAGSCGSNCAHDQGCRCQDQSLRTA